MTPPAGEASRTLVGLMSGTSADGVDAVAVRLQRDTPAGAPRVEVLAHHHEPFAEPVRRRVLGAGGMRPVDLALLHVEMGRRFAEAAMAVMRAARLAPSDVAAVVTAGLTVVHLPPGQGSSAHADADPEALARGATLALGDGDFIAELCGVLTICDLRARDRAAGGQGAPLVPFADEVLLRDPLRLRAALNLGGIANITLVPPRGDVTAFDTGPGNMLVDGYVARATLGRQAFDRDGALARAGRVDRAWLARALAADSFLDQPPPRSTGRERYGEVFLEAHADALGAMTAQDAAATLTAYTVESVARAVREHLPEAPSQLIVSGGGALNPAMMEALAEALAPIEVTDSQAALGIPVLAKEAVAMAIIGDASLSGRPGNVPAVTGASRPAVLGKLCLPPVVRGAPEVSGPG